MLQVRLRKNIPDSVRIRKAEERDMHASSLVMTFKKKFYRSMEEFSFYPNLQMNPDPLSLLLMRAGFGHLSFLFSNIYCFIFENQNSDSISLYITLSKLYTTAIKFNLSRRTEVSFFFIFEHQIYSCTKTRNKVYRLPQNINDE